MQLSTYLTLKEVIKSNEATRLGIDNTPTDEHIENLKVIANEIFEPLRYWAKKPIGVSSGYRSKALNTAVKGSLTSDHCKGMALDIDADIFGGITNAEIFHFIRENLKFTQLVWEYGDDNEPAWVHVSYNPKNLKREVLKAIKGKGYVKY